MNPIFRRYLKSQLRPMPTLIWFISILVFATFFFLLVYLGTGHDDRVEPRIAARFALIPVLAIQAILLMLIGTGATTLAYVREADEGITEYQRLTPMTPFSKVLGYLFGPAIRLYLLVAATMPFAIFAIVKGEIPGVAMFQVYSMIFISAILYHLTGLLAGTVLKKRLLAGMLTMGLVFCINTVLPIIVSRSTGYHFLLYTTPWPTIFLHGSELILDSTVQPRPQLEAFRESLVEVKFFQWQIPTFLFTLVVQGFLIFTFALIVLRKWRRESSHLLGKNFALLFFGGVLVLFLGTSLPLIQSGEIFPSVSTQFGRRYFRPVGLQASPQEGFILAGICGLVTFFIAKLLIQIITPTRDGFIKGLLRSDKEGRKRPRFGDDQATALWHTLVIGVMGAIGWFTFTDAIFDSKWFPEMGLPQHALPVMIGVFTCAAVCFCATLQLFQKGVLWMSILFVWLVPLLVSGILNATGQYAPAIYFSSPSAYAAFFSSLTVLLNGPEFPNLNHFKTTFWIWTALHAFLSVLLVAILQTRQGQLRAQILGTALGRK